MANLLPKLYNNLKNAALLIMSIQYLKRFGDLKLEFVSDN
jgi:hypothetical protein